MVPVLAEMARAHQGRVVFCKVDCEETPRNRQLAQVTLGCFLCI
jgi:hypothetical protein